MTHEQLVEKAFSAILDAKFRDLSTEDTVRAVLTLIADALREPTPAMRSAAMGPDDGAIHGSRKIADYAHQATWRAMLDASPLKDGDSHKPGEGV